MHKFVEGLRAFARRWVRSAYEVVGLVVFVLLVQSEVQIFRLIHAEAGNLTAPLAPVAGLGALFGWADFVVKNWNLLVLFAGLACGVVWVHGWQSLVIRPARCAVGGWRGFVRWVWWAVMMAIGVAIIVILIQGVSHRVALTVLAETVFPLALIGLVLDILWLAPVVRNWAMPFSSRLGEQYRFTFDRRKVIRSFHEDVWVTDSGGEQVAYFVMEIYQTDGNSPFRPVAFKVRADCRGEYDPVAAVILGTADDATSEHWQKWRQPGWRETLLPAVGQTARLVMDQAGLEVEVVVVEVELDDDGIFQKLLVDVRVTAVEDEEDIII